MTDATRPVTLTAEQNEQLRFEFTLGLTAMLKSATAFSAEPPPELSARRTAEVTDIYRFVDATLTEALGAGLAPYERVGPAMDTVTIAIADAGAPKSARSAAVQ